MVSIILIFHLMILAAIVFSVCQFLVFGCFLLILRHLIRSEVSRIREDLVSSAKSFLESPDADTPSPLAQFMDQIALLLAARLVQQVKAMLAGVESGAAKGEQLAMFEQAAESSPWLSIIGGILPKRIRNGLMKNPQMMGALAKLGGNHHASTPEEYQGRKHRE
jgi:hypothetical protein